VSVLQGGDRYRLLSRIATGGMGEVWRAEDTVLDREVAVKILKHEYADDPTFRNRFQAEARHAAGLSHHNIASVFDFGETGEEDGSGVQRPFLVMELVPGQPLSELLRSGDPMPPEQAVDLVAQVADGIAAAHAMGIVHRDVKPANLLVTPDGTVKITDFGIARVTDGASVTLTGQIIGTPHYISPEQAEGASATAASDIYALGVVLYECLAGRRPFNRDTPIQVALAHVREPVPALGPEVPGWLRAVVDRALAKRPEDRFGSAGELGTALRGGAAAAGAAAIGVADVAGPDETQVLPAAAFATPPSGPVDGPIDGAVGGPGAAVPPADTTVPAPGPSGSRAAARHGEGVTSGWPRWWPWAATGAVVLAIVFATAAFAGSGPTAPAAAEASPAAEATPAEKRSAQAAEKVRLRPGDYLGRDHKEVRKELESLGLEVHEEKVAADSPEQRKGTVASVTPHGKVPAAGRVTLGVFEKYKPPRDDAGYWDDEDSEDGDWDEDSDDDWDGGWGKHGDKPGKGKGRGEGEHD
jgi:eukaryotic-like serine/threonine-protein kinase